MGKKQLLQVLRVWKQTDGSVLNETMTSGSPATGDNLSVEGVMDFSPDGGLAVIDSETIQYTGINEATDELTGIVRGAEGTTAAAHTAGLAFVQEGDSPTISKWAEGKMDDEEEIAKVPVPSYLYSLLRVGAYDSDTAPTIPVYYDEDEDEVIVLDGPVGAIPSFDDDLEVLPPVGGGDSSTTTTDPDTGRVLPPKGMGYEDGDVPSTGVTPIVTGGIGTLFVRWTTIANSSIVKYKVHVHTTTGFTPAANTLVGTLDLAGTAGFNAVYVVKDFPTGHILDGTGSDPVVAGTTYYAKVIPSDGSGEFGGTVVQGSGTPVKVGTVLIEANAITATEIATDAVTTPKIAANAVTAAEIQANTITANEIAANAITTDELAANAVIAENILAGEVTASKISVSSLAAITADLGTITAGSLTSVTITSGLYKTAASSNNRLEIGPGGVHGTAHALSWVNSSNSSVAQLTYDFTTDAIQLKNGSSYLLDNTVSISPGSLNVLSGDTQTLGFMFGTQTGDPPTGYVRLYKDANNLMAKAPGRTAVIVAAL